MSSNIRAPQTLLKPRLLKEDDPLLKKDLERIMEMIEDQAYRQLRDEIVRLEERINALHP